MGTVASQITSLTIVYSTVYSGADQRKHQSYASLALCAGNSPVTGEFPAQMASNAEKVSMWWRHHVLEINRLTRQNIRIRGGLEKVVMATMTRIWSWWLSWDMCEITQVRDKSSCVVKTETRFINIRLIWFTFCYLYYSIVVRLVELVVVCII